MRQTDKNSQNSFSFGEDTLTVGLALQLAAGKITGSVGPVAAERIVKSRKIVDDIVSNHEIVYGINTGFGPLCTTIISEVDAKKLQLNLLKSHSVGVGDPINPEIAKLMMILKVHALARGYSGIEMKTLERIIWHINQDIIPVVPSQG
jgi:histidine ammonia-lyase